MMGRASASERAALDAVRVRRVYDRLSRVYDECFDWALGPGRRRAVESLAIRPGDRVLEVGVGTGLSLPYYPRGCQVTGIDISEAMLELARERAREIGRADVDLRWMDAHALAFPAESFDHVLAPYVISVVPEPRRVVEEMCRVCRPGGTVVVVNRFASENPLLRRLERLATPLSQWIGFRLDVPLDSVTRSPGMDLVRLQRVNLFGWWRLVELERRECAAAAAAGGARS
jgi:phosphatidylethanolamine/phosphatidyl-N-methylethanolamine N-methyltransferase